MKKFPTIHTLALVYDTNDRQIARWKADKAPLLCWAKMQLFFLSRRSFPARYSAMTAADRAEMQRKLDALAMECES